MHPSEPKDILQRTMKDYINVNIIHGVISKVYPENMSVDVYVPSTSAILYGVSILNPTISKDSRSIFMPKINTPVLVCTSTTGARPFLLGSFMTVSQETTNKNGLNEILLPGENEIVGSLSFIKQTSDGSLISGGKYSNGESNFSFGKNLSLGLEKEDITLASNEHQGFSIRDIDSNTDRLFLNTKHTFYKEITKPCNVYTPAEVTDSIAEEVISVTSDILRGLHGSSTQANTSLKVSGLQNIFNYYNTPAASEKISEIETLINNFILKPSDVKIELQVGAVSDDEGNIPSNIIQSSWGNDVVLLLRLKDSNDNLIGKIDIDELGKMNIDMPQLSLNGRELGKETIIKNISLNAASWVGATAPYTQVISFPEVMATEIVTVIVQYSSDNSTRISEKFAWNMVNDADTSDGQITFTCFEVKPDITLNLMLILER